MGVCYFVLLCAVGYVRECLLICARVCVRKFGLLRVFGCLLMCDYLCVWLCVCVCVIVGAVAGLFVSVCVCVRVFCLCVCVCC